MYYEEKFIMGILMCRTSPDGAWEPSKTSHTQAANDIYKLTEEERMQVFNLFCMYCGSADPFCTCWNDE